ncbi:hypothetical protein V8G54_010029 [Vigna mungo]|uniref:Uncharacterized protein n=1 Tax=Vigna mungo TaxID=3915 RepID=A0AAQ3NYB1_VIGMU
MSHYIKQTHDLHNGIKYERNDGAYQGFLLLHYWGLGGESRGTSSNPPNPFVVEVGNPTKIKHGFKEKWLFSIMVIDTRGTHDRKEYTIPKNHENDSLHVKKANIPMTKGGYLIHDTDGRVLCTPNPTYGIGKEAGNENGYLVGMSVCYPKPGSIKIKDGEILTIESIYENKFRTEATRHFYIYLAEQIANI